MKGALVSASFFCVQYFVEAEALPKKNKGVVQ